MTKWCAHIKYPQKGAAVYCFYIDGKELEYLCDDCARKAGLCPGCGRFVAMSEWDDFSLQKYGLCEECAERQVDNPERDDTMKETIEYMSAGTVGMAIAEYLSHGVSILMLLYAASAVILLILVLFLTKSGYRYLLIVQNAPPSEFCHMTWRFIGHFDSLRGCEFAISLEERTPCQMQQDDDHEGIWTCWMGHDLYIALRIPVEG